MAVLTHRFTSGREGTLAYYHSLSEMFCKRGIAAAERLDAVVLQMHEGAGSSQRVGLGLNQVRANRCPSIRAAAWLALAK